MSKKGNSSPPPPDPTTVSDAQSAANIASATAQQKLNMINTTGPDGSVTYSADPNSPGGYSQNTTLSPAQQGIYNGETQAQSGALGIANTQLGRVSDALGQNLNPGGVQQSYDPGGAIQSSFNQGGQLQYGYNPGQQVQGHAGAQNFNAATQAASNAVYQQAASRLDPQWQTAQNQEQTQLANQGLSQNSAAYQNAMDTFNRAKNDAYTSATNSAITSGQNEQNTLENQALNQGTFANTAAAQEYAQNQGQAAFNNSTANQDYTQNLGAAQFSNSAQAQQNAENQAAATFGNQANQQQFQQDAYAQSNPINEFNSLMSSGQVQMPTGVSYTPSQVGQTDVTGAYALNSQAAQANATRAAQSQSGLMGGLFSLGSAALMASDRRLKTDIRFLRRRRDGVRVHSFRYRSGGPVQIGVMAQELRKVRPDLVVRRADGMLAVNYLPLGRL